MNYASLEKLCIDAGIDYEKNHLLAWHTTMKIGGNCDFFTKPETEQQLSDIIRTCKAEGIPYFLLGKGSNVLISDKGYRGCIILLSQQFAAVTVNGEEITAEAGASLKNLCMTALDNSLTGIEFAYGIPGSVGGALFMNAGAYGGAMKDIVVSCRYIDENGDFRTMEAEDMELSYRHSVFSGRGCAITSVTMRLKKGDKEEIRARMNDLMMRRRLKQPVEYPSCGSTFKRPEGYFAAALIEECGLKGVSIGGAQVSEKHSGFVINIGSATCADVLALVRLVKDIVREEKGVELECEMVILE